ncbi:uncharacterized protein BDR25DRAFT_344152 [Lindgomyces ingoldianus]|uniref:Uncharacterized protein n=1 Tax=Lindgomyces ingoldianus TaxID=673940 RepID=A0ACB6QQ02_9PLEO|nr:uncharacterized protein BDR25DRAFT_344152 [Lindgomyces ingoldianus]KAF2468960.1 hypothetical protein BDR25DRAFT_344152 [Lindgomyces ingoldianus]
MSGFEIAGVVLGSIPLVISALEHYAEGVSTMKSMQKYGEVFEYLHASFVTSLAIYRNTCEELLSPLALPDSQLYDLLEKIEEHSWEDATLDASLRGRLGPNYLPFKSSLRQIHKKIKLFGHKLRLDSDLRPSWVSQEGVVDTRARDQFFKNPLNRIKGGLNSEKYKELLSSIHEDISRIEALASGAIALEPLRLERKRKANAAYWKRFHRHAQRLYDTFSAKWSTQCVCHCRHQANLRLEMRKEADMNQPSTFKFLFSFDTSTVGPASPWNWRAVEIEPSDNVNPTTTQNPSLPPQIVIQASSKVQNSWNRCLSAAPRIKDLCEALKGQKQNANCIGVLNDSAVKHHIHSVTLPSPKSTTGKHTTIRDFLESRIGRGFGIKEKCTLALTLASAVLQLHNTPWLAENWSMKDIHIMNNAQPSLLTDQPYICKNFASTTPLPQTQHKRSRVVKNSVVFALGIALLEISYGKPLSAFETQDDLDDHENRNPLTEYFVADRLAEKIHVRELRNYADATRRCVHCIFDSSVYSLEDDDFRERFYQGVIVPLQQDYDYVTR